MAMTHYAPEMATRLGAADGARRTDATARAGIADTGRFEIARDWLDSGGSVLFFGQARTGKSTLLDGVVGVTRKPRTLRCTPTDAGADIPFFGLADLLSSITGAELSLLPGTQRRVLISVVRRTTGTDRLATPEAVRLATLTMFRVLADAGPVLLVIDDLHRLDQATADFLRFVAKRLEGVPIFVAAAERVPKGCPPMGRSLCPAPLLMIGMDAYGAGDANGRGVGSRTDLPRVESPGAPA
jgi:AAA ATPase-like protein